MNAFYERLDADLFRPGVAAVGPWNPQLLHGGPPIALLAKALHEFGGARPPVEGEVAVDWAISRLSVEFLGPVALAPCRIELRTLRPGRRIELLEARLSVDGRDALLARAWRVLRESDCAPAVPDAFEPPSLPPAQEPRHFVGVGPFPYAEALEWRFVRGGFDTLGPATLWARPRIPLLLGEPCSGLERLLIMLDSANGVSAELPLREWTFVPIDLQLSLYREPAGDWIGMDARSVIDPGGVGCAHTTVFDATGACGRSLHTLFVRRR
jgi:hypothetical protein